MKNKKLWIIIAVVVVVLAIIGAATQSNNNTDANATSTPTPQVTQPPTATSITKPLTISQRAIQIAQENAPSASKQTAKLDSTGGLTITEFRDVVSQTMVKVDCFNVLKAIWQAQLPGVTSIDFQIATTLTDTNGNQSVASVGECSLSHTLNWSGLTYQLAWSQYDTQFVAPNI